MSERELEAAFEAANPNWQDDPCCYPCEFDEHGESEVE